jgi:hypothetical protein
MAWRVQLFTRAQPEGALLVPSAVRRRQQLAHCFHREPWLPGLRPQRQRRRPVAPLAQEPSQSLVNFQLKSVELGQLRRGNGIFVLGHSATLPARQELATAYDLQDSKAQSLP